MAATPHPFDPGYVSEPFATLCGNYPGRDVYPPADFRVEWGPIFHRGRLDGSARVLVIGQDPGQHESAARRILVGEAGQRVQGFLARLGIDVSYVMLNAFLYSVTHSFGDEHDDDPGIIAYRNAWFDALLAGGNIEAVIAFGTRAREAFARWQTTPAGTSSTVPFRHALHPTFPDSAADGDPVRFAELMAEMLANWNGALTALHPASLHPDVTRPLELYGASLDPDRDVVPIPERDLPAGTPAWMRSLDTWAVRDGRWKLNLTVPESDRT